MAEDTARDEVPADAEMTTGAMAAEAPSETAAPETVAAEPVPSVGTRLRQAREAAGLSLAEVAQTLKFSGRQIELLEADNYAALPGATIVRGFTRSYARLLKLDEGVLLRMLDERTPSTASDVRPPENMGIAEDGDGAPQFSLLASATIVIGLAALLLGVWQYFGKPSRPAAPATVEAPAGAVPVPPVAAPAVEPAAAAPTTAAAAAVAPDVAPPSDKPTLRFAFDGRSWVEVTDGAKQVLHSGENPAGSQLSLSGKPPFDIVVGNAGKVKLTYGERAIDLAPYTRAEVARLKVE